MQITTDRLTISPIDQATAAPIAQLNLYTAVRSALSAMDAKDRAPILAELDETNALLQQIQQESNHDPKEFFGIFLEETLIGVITFIHSHTDSPVLQVEIAPQYRRQGYGYESARGFLDDLFAREGDIFISCYLLTQDKRNLSFLKKLDAVLYLPTCCIEQDLVRVAQLTPLVPLAIAAKKYATNNKPALEKDALCGCYTCCSIYHPSEIDCWITGDNAIDKLGTAMCPYCGTDTVIPESAGYPITSTFISIMSVTR